ncbi:ABCB family ABC transporter ATP-binding protein/permease [Oharaeibacter diazotrophicus]|uniref:ATP-binding cassette subfamily B protein n=1 Tax=Oharaeibacter diazotrophicus TaxID=1920512 RepID=A0A4R6RLC5_9HYPH|nr:ABC transporter ATP-binding protein/permease [Oharaeibacter diazotrophicus]TDP87461.1 ATP-binding cassette subfamily B protein [Oharaeibacter diazotrophicus]BBE70595.1 putative multidrug export ATP-binding/permease protein [Pleomorphomonas sp. SM30]GLS77341.1 ABC transporter ATP-binding protein/permease [Oharaeibacter diazotrophicus]
MKKPDTRANGRTVSADDSTLGKTIANLWPYLWPSERPDLKMRVALAVAALVVAKVATVLVPYLYGWATDALAPEAPSDRAVLMMSMPVFLVVAYGVGRILLNAFNQLRDALFAEVGQYAVRTLAFRTFTHLHALSLRFHLQRRTGGLSRVIERGVKGIDAIVRFTILNAAPTLLEFALSAAVIGFQFGWPYLVVIGLTVWLYVWFSVKYSDMRIDIRRRMNESDTDANTKAIDSLLNFETVKYFGNEAMEAKRFDASMARYEKAAVETWTSLAWLNMGQTLIFTVGMSACMVMSAREVMAGTQTVGDFVLINALLMQLAIPLNFIGFIYREIRQGLADIEQMFDLLDQPAEIVDAPNAVPLKVIGGAVRFEDVVFSYDPDRRILSGISFEVPAGRTVAIVGPSGAGKSTLSRLLFRFYDVTSGRITIDGQDVRDVTQESLRAAIGMVPQDTVLFNDSILYNIRYGRPSASDDEVREAARQARIGHFVESLPQGYASQVGERGLKLSGGEKQRVAIARTILKAPPILILDEATSALDTNTEREIQAELDRVAEGRTTLVIAHRLSTVVGADEIIVLEKGRIAERGTHAALIAAGGLYATMWDRQRAAADAEEQLKRAIAEDDLGVVTRGPRAGEPIPAK